MHPPRILANTLNTPYAVCYLAVQSVQSVESSYYSWVRDKEGKKGQKKPYHDCTPKGYNVQ